MVVYVYSNNQCYFYAFQRKQFIMASKTKSRQDMNKPLKLYIATASLPNLDTITKILKDATFQPRPRKMNKLEEAAQKSKENETCPLSDTYGIKTSKSSMKKYIPVPTLGHSIPPKTIQKKLNAESLENSYSGQVIARPKKLEKTAKNKVQETTDSSKRILCPPIPAKKPIHKPVKKINASSPGVTYEPSYQERNVNAWTSTSWLKYSSEIKADVVDLLQLTNSVNIEVDFDKDWTNKKRDAMLHGQLGSASNDKIQSEKHASVSNSDRHHTQHSKWSDIGFDVSGCNYTASGDSEKGSPKAPLQWSHPTDTCMRELPNVLPVSLNRHCFQKYDYPHLMKRKTTNQSTLPMSNIFLEPISSKASQMSRTDNKSQFLQNYTLKPVSSIDVHNHPSLRYNFNSKDNKERAFRISNIDKHLIGKYIIVDEVPKSPNVNKLEISGNPIKRTYRHKLYDPYMEEFIRNKQRKLNISQAEVLTSLSNRDPDRNDQTGKPCTNRNKAIKSCHIFQNKHKCRPMLYSDYISNELPKTVALGNQMHSDETNQLNNGHRRDGDGTLKQGLNNWLEIILSSHSDQMSHTTDYDAYHNNRSPPLQSRTEKKRKTENDVTPREGRGNRINRSASAASSVEDRQSVSSASSNMTYFAPMTTPDFLHDLN